MRAVVQRVSRASVTVDSEVVGKIGPGFLVLLGVAAGDSEKQGAWLARKIAGLRVFPDSPDCLVDGYAQEDMPSRATRNHEANNNTTCL